MVYVFPLTDHSGKTFPVPSINLANNLLLSLFGVQIIHSVAFFFANSCCE